MTNQERELEIIMARSMEMSIHCMMTQGKARSMEGIISKEIENKI